MKMIGGLKVNICCVPGTEIKIMMIHYTNSLMNVESFLQLLKINVLISPKLIVSNFVLLNQ